MGPMAPGGYGGMRPPPNSMGGPGGPGGGMPPGMGMPPGGPGGRPWQPNTSQMNQYSSASPGNHYGGPPGSGSGPGPGPGTPIMPSPQGNVK